MAIFSLSGVLRGFLLTTVQEVRLSINPCAALLNKKVAHF